MSNLSGSIVPLRSTSDLQHYSAGSGSAQGNGEAFLASDVTMPTEAMRITVTICTGTGSIFNAKETSGANANLQLNSGNPLTANVLYTFTFACRPAQTWNFNLSTAGTVTYFALEANYGGI